MKLPKIMYYFMLLMFVSCTGNDPAQSSNEPLEKANVASNELTIVVQPFDDLPEGYLGPVIKELRKVYPRVVVQPPIKLPPTALNQSGTRYRADSLIRFLRDYRYFIKSGHVTLGLTSKDVSVTRSQISDCCIMGLAFRPGNACIASSFRLKAGNKTRNLFKLALHELGHTQGLHHCSRWTCLMRTTRKNHFDELKGFCPKCKKTLLKAGWTLK
ncbi:MAG: matrixin family metalloprotease [Paludibacter sp.]